MDILEQIIYILRNNKKILLLIGVILGLGAVIYAVFNYTFLTIATTGLTQDGTVIITGGSEKSETVTSQDPSRTFFIKRGTNLVKLRSGENESESPIKFRPFRTEEVTLQIESQKQIKKTISASFDCGTFQSGRYFSYKCIGYSDVITPSVSDSGTENKVVVTGAQSLSIAPTPYQKGLLALSGITGADDEEMKTQLIYTDLLSGTTKNQVLPSSLGTTPPENLTVVSNNTASSFLVVDSGAHKAHWFKSLADQKPAELQFNADTGDTLSGTRCVLEDEKAACLQARFENTSEVLDGENAPKKLAQPTLYVFNSQGELEFQKKVGSKIPIDQFGYNSGNLYTLDFQNNLRAYTANTDGVDEKWDRTEIKDFALKSNGELYMQKSDELWLVRPDQIQSNLVFRSSNVRISSIQATGNKLFITGLLNNQLDSRLMQFELLAEDKAKDHLEDKLPTRTGYIRELDYTSTGTLFIKLALTSYTSNRQTGQFSVDQTELNSAKQAVTKQLQQDGSLSAFTTIKFSY